MAAVLVAWRSGASEDRRNFFPPFSLLAERGALLRARPEKSPGPVTRQYPAIPGNTRTLARSFAAYCRITVRVLPRIWNLLPRIAAFPIVPPDPLAHPPTWPLATHAARRKKFIRYQPGRSGTPGNLAMAALGRARPTSRTAQRQAPANRVYSSDSYCAAPSRIGFHSAIRT
jgi:hypothetical protein